MGVPVVGRESGAFSSQRRVPSGVVGRGMIPFEPIFVLKIGVTNKCIRTSISNIANIANITYVNLPDHFEDVAETTESGFIFLRNLFIFVLAIEALTLT
jgi:hypothetical protein